MLGYSVFVFNIKLALNKGQKIFGALVGYGVPSFVDKFTWHVLNLIGDFTDVAV